MSDWRESARARAARVDALDLAFMLCVVALAVAAMALLSPPAGAPYPTDPEPAQGAESDEAP